MRAQDAPPREVIFVVDVSGSMSGFPLETGRALMRKLLAELRPVDRFNVIEFAGGNRALVDGATLTATRQNLARGRA